MHCKLLIALGSGLPFPGVDKSVRKVLPYDFMRAASHDPDPGRRGLIHLQVAVIKRLYPT